MFSSVRLIGETDNEFCLYCGKSDSTWYTITGEIAAKDYKILIDSGWRRKGLLIRKPNNRKSCCPAYTIRCDAENYRFAKAQKKVLRAIHHYLMMGKISQDEEKHTVINELHRDPPVDAKELVSAIHKVSLEASGDSGFASEVREDSVNSGRPNSARRRRWQALQDRMAKRAEELGVPYQAVLEEYRLRRQMRLDKNKPKELEEYLHSLHGEQANPAHTIDVRMYSCTNRSPEFEASLDEEFRLYSDYQVCVHKDAPDKWTRDSYIAYLVDTPLVSVHDAKVEACGAPQFGTYHQQYWLDGKKLIGVGVVDLVPGCLSSVYFFYDPAYAFLRLGTYSALREIAFVRHLHHTYGSVVPAYAEFTHYYMGFYVHSCGKMVYKNNYQPSYLVCPETYTWTPLERCQRLLDRSKYVRFAEANVKKVSNVDVGGVVVLLPLLPSLTCILPNSRFTVEGETIVATVAAARRTLSEHNFQLVKSWANLVLSTGTMRIDLTH